MKRLTFGEDHWGMYHIGDCIHSIGFIDSNTVDLVLTDPPFNVGIDYGDTTDDEQEENSYGNWCYEWISQLYDKLKEGRACVIFTSDENLYQVQKAVRRTGFKFLHYIKWRKPNCQRAYKGYVLFQRVELALLLTKGEPNRVKHNRKVLHSDTLVHNVVSRKSKDDIHSTCTVRHPCTRPVQLYDQIIKGLTDEGELVLDPFLGSGTTLYSCRRTNRNGIGFEINPDYEKKILTRVRNKDKSLDDF